MPSSILADVGFLPTLAARAWRSGPEMLEVADTLRAAGLPSDLAEGAASVMELWEDDKDQQPAVADVLRHLKLRAGSRTPWHRRRPVPGIEAQEASCGPAVRSPERAGTAHTRMYRFG